MDLFTILSSLEKDENIHLGRLLILISVFSEKNGAEIEGLTKLAKLDFLLRYPSYLERALMAVKKPMVKGAPKEYERVSVEAKMIRFRYGPWDFRYRRFINSLICRGLIYLRPVGRSYYLGITDQGSLVAQKLAHAEDLRDLLDRAYLIKSNFNYSGTHLMRFIYATFPEISTLQFGTEIL